MAVRKFRSVEEMPDEVWREPGSPELMRSIAAVWEFAERTCPRRFPRGVYKHRSIEAMNAQTEAWAEENFRRLWEARETES